MKRRYCLALVLCVLALDVPAASAAKPAPKDKPLAELSGHTQRVMTVAFSPNGRLTLSGSQDHSIRLWSVATGQELLRLQGHTSLVRCVVFSADGSQVLSASYDRTVRLWDVMRGLQLQRFEGHTGDVNTVALSRDGRHIVTGGDDRTMCLWDVRSGREMRRFEGHADRVYGVAFCPAGGHAVSASADGTARLWDLRTGRQVRTFSGHQQGIVSVAVSPDGRYVLTGSWDQTLRLWDIETGQQIRKFVGHSNSVWSVAFSSDGRRALSAGFDKTMRLWDVHTGREIHCFKGFRQPLWTATFFARRHQGRLRRRRSDAAPMAFAEMNPLGGKLSEALDCANSHRYNNLVQIICTAEYLMCDLGTDVSDCPARPIHRCLMLVEFRVANFRSFHDEQTLSLEASKDETHRDNCIPINDHRLLKAAAIYGPNASGKSNLIKAIDRMAWFVKNSATSLNQGDAIPVAVPFRLTGESATKPSTFAATIILTGSIYEYGFSVVRERVCEEWLTVRSPEGRKQALAGASVESRHNGNELGIPRPPTTPSAIITRQDSREWTRSLARIGNEYQATDRPLFVVPKTLGRRPFGSPRGSGD